ncbi:hypothetical protein BDR06DRAFT_958794, partial [Suillus hirtellus]
MGDTFSYADIIVASRLFWYKSILKEDEWARISSWNGGRWAKVLDKVQQECHLASRYEIKCCSCQQFIILYDILSDLPEKIWAPDNLNPSKTSCHIS